MAIAREQVYRNLAVLLEAGVPLIRSLRTAVPAASGRTAKGFSALAEGVSAGDGLAGTMAKHPDVFTPLEVLLVEVGETSGELPESMRLLADWYAFRRRLRRIIQSGLLLPLLLFHALAVLGPLPGLFLGRTGLAGYLAQVAGVLAALYVPAGVVLAIVHLSPRAGQVRRVLDRAALGIPLLGGGIRQLALGRFCRGFQALFRAGVDVIRSVELSSDAAGNTIVAAWLRAGADSARAGGDVSEGFSGRLPREFLESWRIGEQTGQLDEAAGRLAETALESAESTFVALGTWLPRLLYLIICLVMAVQIVSAYGMIWSLAR